MHCTARYFGRRPLLVVCVTLAALFGTFAAVGGKEYLSGIIWPEPPVVDPEPVDGHPRDAIVLFGGKDMSEWNGGERWQVKDGIATARGGGISTKRSFGDCQVHVEWASPEKVEGKGQGRGNSGVYLMGNYEVQILDSHNNPTYFDGQAGSLYKQSPPLVNASRKPGEWQTYDIFFKAPVFDRGGKVVKPAYVTVMHNGICVQNNFEIQGTSAWDAAPAYNAHAAKAPLQIQFHGNPVRFRNIWIRELARQGEVKYPEKKNG
jgi:hypothetical protein